MSEDFKMNQHADAKGVADFLRLLAENIENGGRDEFACLEDFRKIKIGIKNEFGQLSMKVRIKAAKPCEGMTEDSEAAEGKLKYSSLKKRMKSSFRVLVNMIHEGNVPPREAVDAFLADSALMVTYPGYGDEFYDHYILVCDEFKAAYESGDMEKMNTAVDALIHEKSRCHAKYD